MSWDRAWQQQLPACLLRRWLTLGVDEPFPRGRKSAAPFTVRKLSLMLQGKRQEMSERNTALILKGEKQWRGSTRGAVLPAEGEPEQEEGINYGYIFRLKVKMHISKW